MTTFDHTVTSDHIDDNICQICMSSIDSKQSVLPCKHIFHKTCIMKWIVNQKPMNAISACPTCRSKINDDYRKNIHSLQSISKDVVHPDDPIDTTFYQVLIYNVQEKLSVDYNVYCARISNNRDCVWFCVGTCRLDNKGYMSSIYEYNKTSKMYRCKRVTKNNYFKQELFSFSDETDLDYADITFDEMVNKICDDANK